MFEHLFDHVFAQCVAAGLVAGDTQAIDSAPVKANASLDSVFEKHAGPTPAQRLAVAEPSLAQPHVLLTAALRAAPAHQLRYEVARQVKLRLDPSALGASNPKARLLSNKTHYSPTDPEARISVKPGKTRALHYLRCKLLSRSAISHYPLPFIPAYSIAHNFRGCCESLLPIRSAIPTDPKAALAPVRVLSSNLGVIVQNLRLPFATATFVSGQVRSF